MLNLFPELLNWSFFAPLVLRITLGVVILFSARELWKKGASDHLRSHKNEGRLAYSIMSGLLLALSVLLIIGLYVQIGAAISFSLSIITLYLKKKQSPDAPESALFYVLAGSIALSLITLGAGAFAIDLPL